MTKSVLAAALLAFAIALAGDARAAGVRLHLDGEPVDDVESGPVAMRWTPEIRVQRIEMK